MKQFDFAIKPNDFGMNNNNHRTSIIGLLSSQQKRLITICYAMMILVFIITLINCKSNENKLILIKANHLLVQDEYNKVSAALSNEMISKVKHKYTNEQYKNNLIELTDILNQKTNTLPTSIKPYLNFVSKQYYTPSLLSNENDYEKMLSFIRSKNNYDSSKAIDLELKYKATIHGDTKYNLYKRIYGIDKLLMLIKIKENTAIIGGYSSISWDWKLGDNDQYFYARTWTNSFYQSHLDSFLFSLTSNKYYPINITAKENKAIIFDNKYFFSFGIDLQIKEEFLNSENKGTTDFPMQYTHSPTRIQALLWELTQTTDVFTISEIEVYEVNTSLIL